MIYKKNALEVLLDAMLITTHLNVLRNILSNIIIKIERKGGIAYGNNQPRF